MNIERGKHCVDTRLRGLVVRRIIHILIYMYIDRQRLRRERDRCRFPKRLLTAGFERDVCIFIMCIYVYTTAKYHHLRPY